MNDIKENCLYFVKNEFFELVDDAYLKTNKETTMRPHYFPFIDSKTGLYWLIPCSSRIEKYERIIEDKIAKHKPHNHIQIIKISGKKQVFLYQDMFPIAPQYIDKPYSNKYGIFELKDKKQIEQVRRNALKIIKLLKHNIKFTATQPDVDRIEALMLEVIDSKQLSNLSVNEKSET